MKNRLLLVVGVIGIFLWAVACQEKKEEKFISEGEIEYKAVAVDEDNPMASMAPTKMIIKFKANKSCAEMSAGMGLFTTSFISDPETKSVTQLVKLLNKKFLLVKDRETILRENQNDSMDLVPTNETKEIAGYNCFKIRVIPKDGSSQPFEIYYTKELNIKEPNFSNPYYKVDGVLMEYKMKKFGLEMKFVATKIKNKVVDDNCFEVPTGYKKVTEKEMKAIFDGLQ